MNYVDAVFVDLALLDCLKQLLEAECKNTRVHIFAIVTTSLGTCLGKGLGIGLMVFDV